MVDSSRDGWTGLSIFFFNRDRKAKSSASKSLLLETLGHTVSRIGGALLPPGGPGRKAERDPGGHHRSASPAGEPPSPSPQTLTFWHPG